MVDFAKNFRQIFIFSFFVLLCFSCSTIKKSENINLQNNKSEIIPQAAVSPPLGNGTLLAMPAKTELAKIRLSSELIENVNKGSPVSLKTAMLYIQNDSKGLTEANKTYFKIIKDLMFILYPLELKNERPSYYTGSNELLLALQSVKNGEYPQFLKENSFLELIIPPLILAVKNNADYENHELEIKDRLEKAKIRKPKSVLPYYLLGRLSEKNNMYEAFSYYKIAWDIDNSCYPAGFRYGELCTEIGKGEIALKVASVLAQFYPENDLLSQLYAKIYISLGNLELASKYIVSMLKKNPENFVALLLRVKVLIEQKEYLKANTLLDIYAKKSKTSKDYLLFRSQIAMEWNKNLLFAMDFLSTAYKLYPNDFQVLLSCAEICFETSEDIENHDADFFIKKVLEKSPQNVLALSLLLKNNINHANWNDAISLANRLNNKSSTLSNKKLLIKSYLGGKMYDKAFLISHDLYNSSKSSDLEVIQLYAETLFHVNKHSILSKIITSKLPSANSELKSILYYYRAKIMKNRNKAYLDALRSSLLSNPRNKQSLFAMYEWYFYIKDYRKAKYYLGQVIALSPKNKNIINLSKKLDRLLAD